MQFTVSDKEEKRAKKWIRKHLKICKRAKRLLRDPFVSTEFLAYVCTPSSVGTSVEAQCTCCKHEKDVTDYSTW